MTRAQAEQQARNESSRGRSHSGYYVTHPDSFFPRLTGIAEFTIARDADTYLREWRAKRVAYLIHHA